MLLRKENYRIGFTAPLLKCLTLEQVEYVLNEMHRGICKMHLGSLSMVVQVLRVEYYWPIIRRDCTKYAKKCEECLKFDNISHLPPEELHNIVGTFATWGVYIVRSFPAVKG